MTEVEVRGSGIKSSLDTKRLTGLFRPLELGLKFFQPDDFSCTLCYVFELFAN